MQMLISAVIVIILTASLSLAESTVIVVGQPVSSTGCVVASETLRPNGDFSTQWDQSTGYSDLVSDQSDSTYTTTSTGYEIVAFSLGDVVNTTCAIDSVVVYTRAMVDTGSAQARGSLRIGGNGYNATDINVPSGSIAQTNFAAWTVNPATLDAWEYTDIDDMQVLVSSRGLYGQTLTLAELWVVVNYAQ